MKNITIRYTFKEKWDLVWYRKLTPIQKCFYDYINTRCKHSGIWDVDFETASHYIGADLNESELKKIFAGKFIELNAGERWLILDYIAIQHKGILRLSNQAQKKAYEELLELGLITMEGTLKLLRCPSDVPKEKAIEIEEAKYKEIKVSTEKEKTKSIDISKAEELEELMLKDRRKGKVLEDNSDDCEYGEPDGFLQQ